MKYVTNDRELRVAYEILDILGRVPGGKYRENMDETKRAIRAYRDFSSSDQRKEKIISNEGDSVVTLVQLPERLKSYDEANAYFLDWHYREISPSPYDCTGQIFLLWYKIFMRGGHFWAYHATAMDV